MSSLVELFWLLISSLILITNIGINQIGVRGHSFSIPTIYESFLELVSNGPIVYLTIFIPIIVCSYLLALSVYRSKKISSLVLGLIPIFALINIFIVYQSSKVECVFLGCALPGLFILLQDVVTFFAISLLPIAWVRTRMADETKDIPLTKTLLPGLIVIILFIFIRIVPSYSGINSENQYKKTQSANLEQYKNHYHFYEPTFLPPNLSLQKIEASPTSVTIDYECKSGFKRRQSLSIHQYARTGGIGGLKEEMDILNGPGHLESRKAGLETVEIVKIQDKDAIFQDAYNRELIWETDGLMVRFFDSPHDALPSCVIDKSTMIKIAQSLH